MPCGKADDLWSSTIYHDSVDLAGHADPKTTKLYDRRAERVALDEIERIGI